jgi:hypothetical protein
LRGARAALAGLAGRRQRAALGLTAVERARLDPPTNNDHYESNPWIQAQEWEQWLIALRKAIRRTAVTAPYGPADETTLISPAV